MRNTLIITFLTVIIVGSVLWAFYSQTRGRSTYAPKKENEVVDSVVRTLSGKVTKIEGDVVTLQKGQSNLDVTIDSDAVIFKVPEIESFEVPSAGTEEEGATPSALPEFADPVQLKIIDLKVGDLLSITQEVVDGKYLTRSVTVTE